LQLLFLHHEELVLTNLVAAPFIRGLHHFTRDGIDKLLPKAVAGLPVHLPEGNPLGR